MAIDLLTPDNVLKGVSDVVSLRNAKASARETNKLDAKSAPSNNSSLSADDVVFTQNAQDLAKATSLAMQDEGIDHKKVASIKQQLADGTYEVNAQRVAEKIIASEQLLNS